MLTPNLKRNWFFLTPRSVAEKKTDEIIERFESHAHYKAGDNGEVSVPDQAASGGLYTGKKKRKNLENIIYSDFKLTYFSTSYVV